MTMKNKNGNRVASFVRRIVAPSTLAAQRRCRGCGSDVPLGLKFCTHCGQPLSARRS